MIARIRQRLDNSATYWKIKVASEVFLEKAAQQLYCMCHCPRDMTSGEIAGFKVGMSQETVMKIAASLHGVAGIEQRETDSKLKPANRRLRALYLDFEDDSFVGVSFSETNSGNQVCEIALVRQDRSFTPDLLEKAIKEYGRPDFQKINRGLTQAAWGGRATDQAAVVAYPGVSTTLSAELIGNRQFNLILVAHGIIAEQL